ncbi:MAG: PQQ-like beta-propeller repeat protein, partial [bacterium]|nr:PQQ-like beta-propeller repeat protein [bacterium]
EAKLNEAPELEAQILFEDLMERNPGAFQPGQLSTFQRKVKRWRAQKGPGKETPATHPVPGGRPGFRWFCDHRGFFDALVHARSGDSGALLWQIALPGLEGAPFTSMAPIADQNEDGIEDVLVGVYDSEAHGPLMEGRLHALSGTTGQVIWQIDEWDVKR